MKPTRVTLFSLLLGVLLIGSPANAAKLYKWVDEQGRVSYQDRPPPEDSNFSESTLSDPGDVDPAIKSYQDKMAAAVAKSPLVLYVIPDCDGCDLIRSYLDKRNIPFAEKNVEKDPKVQAELKDVAGRLEVPLLVVGERVLRGYSKPVLETELDSAGFPKVDDKPEGIPAAATTAAPSPASEQKTETASEAAPIDFEELVKPATDDDIFKNQPAAGSESGSQGGS
ncbi:glutaredoxin family protein [Pseudomonadota bacterium]